MIGHVFLNPDKMTIIEVIDGDIHLGPIVGMVDCEADDTDELSSADVIVAEVDGRFLTLPIELLQRVH